MQSIERTRIMIEHLDPLTRAGLTYTLASCQDFELVEAPAGAHVHVVISDYESGMRRLCKEGILRRAGAGGSSNVLIVTQRDSEAEIRHALEAGAGGFLLVTCSLDELLEGIRAVRRGLSYLGRLPAHRIAQSLTRTPLTCRELEVLRLMATGKANKVIARQLDIALGTVKAHTKSILSKLEATSRTEATFLAEQRGLLSPLPDGAAPDEPTPLKQWRPLIPPGLPQLRVA